MAWCKANISDFVRWTFFFKSAWILHVLFNLVVKHSPVIFCYCYALCFWEKRGQNIEACTMSTTRWNKRKPFFKFLAPLLVCIVVQVIKAWLSTQWITFFRVSVQILNFSLCVFLLFALLLSGKSTCKNSGTFEEKKFTRKSHLC